MLYRIVALISLLFFAAGCSKEKRLWRDLDEKEWNIETSKRWVIYNDGGTLQYEDLKDAGTVYIRPDPASVLDVKEVRMVYTNFNGNSTDFTTAIYANEDGTRIGMSNVLCNSPFMCDLVWNVEESTKNKQTWSAFGADDVFFFPPDLYNANKEHHLKWEITLEKVGKYE